MLRIAINGFGRIGRCVMRALFENTYDKKIQLVAINDLAEKQLLAAKADERRKKAIAAKDREIAQLKKQVEEFNPTRRKGFLVKGVGGLRSFPQTKFQLRRGSYFSCTELPLSARICRRHPSPPTCLDLPRLA